MPLIGTADEWDMATSMAPGDIGKFADVHNIGELAEPLRSRLHTIFIDCPSPMSLVSGYRTPWQQWLIRHERCPGQEFSFAQCPGHPTAAVPYGSNHQKRLAADAGGSGMNWCLARLAAYGLARTVPNELWHWEAKGTPTVRILPYSHATAPPTTHPTRSDFPKNGVRVDGPVNEILWLQDFLSMARAHQKKTSIRADGDYGNQTKAAVAEFQRYASDKAVAKDPKTAPWQISGAAGPKTVGALLYWVNVWF